MTQDEVYQKVSSVLTEALNLDEGEVKPDANLSSLGAEPIDILDIVFRLEGKFGVKISRDEWVNFFPNEDTDHITVNMVNDYICGKIEVFDTCYIA